MHQVRAAVLFGYLQVAATVGLDGPRLLRQAGISQETLDKPETRLPAKTVIGLIDRSAELSGCENFGVLMAEARTFASLGPLSLLLERLPNPREIVGASIDFQRHLNDVVSVAIEDAGDTCIVRVDLAPGFWSVPVFDHVVLTVYRVLINAMGNSWQPEALHLVRKSPHDLKPWRRVVRAPIEFDATFNGMSATRAAMRHHNPNADPAMARHAKQLLHLVHVESEDTTSERVRRSIVLLLPSGRATIEQVAAQRGLSARSLQRRLDAEGQQFGDLLSDVRSELATAYLANSAHPITMVSGLLGYASPSSFARWFAATFGTTPQAWRAENGDRDPSPLTASKH